MKTGIHFERCNVASSEAHNQRDPKYLENVERSEKKHYDIFHDRTNQNSHWTNTEYEGKTLPAILDEMRQRYRDYVGQLPQEEDKERVIKGVKKTIHGWSPIREGVCPVNENTEIQDFKPFIEWLQEKGIKVISIDIHLDEGHIDENGDRQYNRHAHIVCDWTDHCTGKTIKLGKDDMSESQKILADALKMERGKASGAKHLSALEFREKKAAEHLVELQEKLKQAMIALETVEAQAELADAKKQELRVSLYDTLARIGNLFGKGAIAAAQSEMEEAKSRAIAAEAASRQAESLAAGAKRSETKAKNEKAKYGREMYEMGLSEGRRIGVNSRNDEVRELKRLHNELKQRLDKLQQEAKEQLQQNDRNHKNQLDAVTAQKEQVILELQKFQSLVLKIFPNLENIEQNWQDMKSAGLSPEQRKAVLTEGSLDTVIQVPLYGKKFKVPAKVEMARSKQQKMHVWFNKLSIRRFVDKAIETIKKTAVKTQKR
jgi:hypothetical protein